MSTTPQTFPVIVSIDELRRQREAREQRARNDAANDVAILVDRIRADLVRLRRLTDAETVSRFLTGRLTALGGPPESL